MIGFIILIFMYAPSGRVKKERLCCCGSDKNFPDANELDSRGKRRFWKTKKIIAQDLFMYLLLSIMLFLIFDTGMFLLDGTVFPGAISLNYIFTMLFYIVSPLPGVFYLLYCDNKVLKKINFIKRFIIYSVPIVINIILVLSTPFTNLLFSIDGNNVYSRGSLYWFPVFLSFIYVFSIYPVLMVQSKKQNGTIFKKENLNLYLFPLPPLILAIFQILNYGVLLIGFGFVFSAFLIYTNSIQSAEDRRSLAVRFKNLNIIQFAVISSVMMAGIFLVLENVTSRISRDYAAYNSVGAAHILETYLNKEIGVLGTAARSKAVTEWAADEDNPVKKQAAFDELTKTLSLLYNDNIYLVAGVTGNEYTIGRETDYNDFISHAFISEDNPKDKWVFDLMMQSHEYNLNVDIDKGENRKRVWLNFKLTDGQDTVGVICTGMELSDIAELALLLKIDYAKSRTFIIDENGYLIMDSSLLGDEDFLLYGDPRKIDEEITNPELLNAIQTHLDNINGYFSELYTESTVVALYTGRHRYATITPIGTTIWSLVTLYDTSSLFGIINLLPLLMIVLTVFIIFTLSSTAITTRLIFTPLKQLVESLINMRRNNEQNIYGLDRGDEIGLLSNAIQDYFVKGYYDELTGIYNRRYLETTLQQIITTLSRTEFKMSVMLLDIDHFKKYNDSYGHDQGDKCLRIIAETLNKCITRKGDFAARYGGEEFAIVLPHADEEGAKILAENIINAIQDLKITHEQGEGGIVTISIGVTTGINTSVKNREDYLKKADEALYMSKRNGRNRFTFLGLT